MPEGDTSRLIDSDTTLNKKPGDTSPPEPPPKPISTSTGTVNTGNLATAKTEEPPTSNFTQTLVRAGQVMRKNAGRTRKDETFVGGNGAKKNKKKQKKYKKYTKKKNKKKTKKTKKTKKKNKNKN